MGNLRWSKYTLPNGRKVFLTQRPDRVDNISSVFEFIKKEEPLIRFQYTDDHVDFPEHPLSIPKEWYIWIPGKNPTLESIYASTISLQKYNETHHPNCAIWMHCDSSSMRAPTYFGMFLHATYPDQVEEVSNTIDVFPEKDTDYAKYSMPNKYAQIAFEIQPELLEMMNWWKKGEKYAYYFVQGYDMKVWGKFE